MQSATFFTISLPGQTANIQSGSDTLELQPFYAVTKGQKVMSDAPYLIQDTIYTLEIYRY